MHRWPDSHLAGWSAGDQVCASAAVAMQETAFVGLLWLATSQAAPLPSASRTAPLLEPGHHEGPTSERRPLA